MELCAFAEPFDAQAALEMHLINRICEPGRAPRRRWWRPEVRSHSGRRNALMKSALNTGNDSVDQAIATEVNYSSILQNTQDFAEAAAAFAQKRKPKFTGR